MIHCRRCLHEFLKKHYLIAHLKKTKLCDINGEDISRDELLKDLIKEKLTDGYPCKKCGKIFKGSQNRYQHEKKYCNSEISLHTEIEKLKLENDKLRNTISINNSNNNINNNNNNNNNNNIVIINNFGSENTQHIIEDKTFLEKCIKNIKNDGMKNLLEKIHYDSTHPENNNIRIKSIKRDLCEVFDNNAWNIMDKNESLDKMIRNGYKILTSFYDNQIDLKEYDLAELDGRLFQLMMKVGDKDPHIYFPLRKKIYALLINKKCFVMEGPEDEAGPSNIV